MPPNRTRTRIALAGLTLIFIIASAGFVLAARRWQMPTSTASVVTLQQNDLAANGTVPPPTLVAEDKPEEKIAFTSPLALPMPALQARANKPPLCVFNSSRALGSTLEATAPQVTYTFGEPRIILTNTTAIDVGEWLPEENRLLYARRSPDHVYQTVETFDPATGETQILGERIAARRKAMWLSAVDAVGFYSTEFSGSNPRIGTDNLVVIPKEPKSPARTIEAFSKANAFLDPAGYLVQYSGDEARGEPLPEAARDLLPTTLIPIPLEELLYPKPHAVNMEGKPGLSFQYSRSRDGSFLILYGQPYLYLLDLASSSLCEIDLGSGPDGYRYPLFAQWSPDNRYLALITTIGTRTQSLLYFTELTLLDMVTGVQRQLPNEWNAIEIDWAPDSNHLLLLERQKRDSNPGSTRQDSRLAFIEITTSEITYLMSDYTLDADMGIDTNMSWSSDGQYLAVNCRATAPDGSVLFARVCMSEITLNEGKAVNE